MTVECDNCKVEMALVEKTQDGDLSIIRSTYTCDTCHARILIGQQGLRKEDPAAERGPLVTHDLNIEKPSP